MTVNRRIIILNDINTEMTDPGVMHILKGIEETNRDHRHAINSFTFDLKKIGILEQYLLESKPDCLITLDTLPDDTIDKASRSGIKLVGVRCNAESRKMHTVQIDNVKVGKLAAEYFIKHCAEKIVFFLGPLVDPNHNRRSAFYIKKGYVETMYDSETTSIAAFFNHGDWKRDVTGSAAGYLEKGADGFYSASQFFSDKITPVLEKEQKKLRKNIKFLAAGLLEMEYPCDIIGYPYLKMGMRTMELVGELLKDKEMPVQKRYIQPELKLLG